MQNGKYKTSKSWDYTVGNKTCLRAAWKRGMKNTYLYSWCWSLSQYWSDRTEIPVSWCVHVRQFGMVHPFQKMCQKWWAQIALKGNKHLECYVTVCGTLCIWCLYIHDKFGWVQFTWKTIFDIFFKKIVKVCFFSFSENLVSTFYRRVFCVVYLHSLSWS